MLSYPCYDEGNLIRKTEIATGEYTEYEYDYRNRMTAATTYSAGAIILQEVTYTYDVFDRRIVRTVDADGAGPQAAETTYTAYDGHNAWADFDEAGAVLARYLFGNNIDQILARFRPGEGTAWYLTDQLGSVRDILDSAGTLIDHIDYDSFGNIITETNAAAGDRFKFTGREWDSELALYYYRARFYDPAIGRFVSQDPLGFGAGDANLYRYVGNSPLMYTDPLGLFFVSDAFITRTDLAIGMGAAGFVWGFICGYVEGWTEATLSGDPNPVAHATAKAIEYATYGLIIGTMLGGFPELGPLALIYFAYAIYLDAPNVPREVTGVRIGCLAAGLLEGYFGRGAHGRATKPSRGTPKPSVVGPKRLTPQEAVEIQAIANKYNTRIDVGGSRAKNAGRNIHRPDLPVDKGPGTRSDIDFIVDPDHPQFNEIMAELREVGDGAGSLHPDFRFLSKYDSGETRLRFEPGSDPKVVDGN